MLNLYISLFSSLTDVNVKINSVPPDISTLNFVITGSLLFITGFVLVNSGVLPADIIYRPYQTFFETRMYTFVGLDGVTYLIEASKNDFEFYQQSIDILRSEGFAVYEFINSTSYEQ